MGYWKRQNYNYKGDIAFLSHREGVSLKLDLKSPILKSIKPAAFSVLHVTVLNVILKVVVFVIGIIGWLYWLPQ